ncbi:integrase domain-containing protein [Endozoicomonas sp. ONNA1]|uniref:integrase domain-containing protein n=1 Tax=Endozoicomonas sp. ONNA1 TaxID=2828740 RepID=UPI00214795F9
MSHFLSRNGHNFGFGRQLSYAGRNALRAMMPGQFCTVSTHSERWKQFCAWSQARNICEAHQVNNQTLKHYAVYLRARLEGQGRPLSVATAQNLLSTCNVVLKALRGNEDIRIKPSEALQVNREKIRTEPPELSRDKLAQAQAELILKGQERIAAVLGLCRELGLRSREAVLLDCRRALEQDKACGKIDIERGTKGGRGKSTSTSPSRVERWVPVSGYARMALSQAVRMQGDNDCLIPIGKKLEDFLALVRMHSGPVLKKYGLNNRHDLRAAYACEQYQQNTGCSAPVLSSGINIDKHGDLQARKAIADLLGHHRSSVVSAYIGSNQRDRSKGQLPKKRR